MYRKILVAVDHSEHSDRAVKAAWRLAQLCSASVHLVHIKEGDVIAARGGGYYEREDTAHAEALLTKDAGPLVDAGLSVTTEVRSEVSGHVADAIVASAHAFGADLIVVGSHGRSGVVRVLLGGTAYKVVHLSDLDVLIVR